MTAEKQLEILANVQAMVAELQSLRQWKAEQLIVMSAIDLQSTGKALGLPAGSFIPALILPEILKLKQKVSTAEARRLTEKVERIKPLLQQLASNPRLMQLAGPARQALNILKE